MVLLVSMAKNGRSERRRRGCAREHWFARLAFALLLGAFCWVAAGDWRDRAVSFTACGIQSGAAAGQADALSYESPSAAVNSMLPREREDDPFQALLALRSSANPSAPHPFVLWAAALRGHTAVVIPAGWRGSPPLHLHRIVTSRQLLC